MSNKETKESKVPVLKLAASGLYKDSMTNFESGLIAGPGRVDPNNNTLSSNALEYEDDFKDMYGSEGDTQNKVVIQPPFNPLDLERIVKHNNTLEPCIEAMKTNIDGTGFELIRSAEDKNKDEDDSDSPKEDKDLHILKSFFAEPWPGKSFTTIRRDLRQDIETVGYGFLEVIRNPKGQIMFLRHVPAKTMRLMKLDAGRTVTREVNRGGVKRSVKINLRFRRFVQKVGGSVVYFKEFQADPDLDKKTGDWAKEGTALGFAKKATEIIYFVLNKDITTPYGVPRWIAQTPSIMGSRKAEENNLSFFSSGGIPPFILIVQGGILAQETKDALESALSSSSVTKQRGLVIEAHSSDGSIDDKSNVKVQVERFGGEKQKDSQFEVYDNKCEIRIRGSFRLPPIFVGRTGEYNFASAFASYMVGEAQIFKPERDEFDEIITLRLIPEILGKDNEAYQFRSLPIVVNDAKEKILAVKTASDKKAISNKELVRNLNEISGLEMVHAKESDDLPADEPSADNEGISSNSAITDASTSDPNGPQGTVDTKKQEDYGVEALSNFDDPDQGD